jgi:hypothetical protein
MRMVGSASASHLLADHRTERAKPDHQDEFREDAHNLLRNVLEKNNEAEDRRVRLSPYRLCIQLT